MLMRHRQSKGPSAYSEPYRKMLVHRCWVIASQHTHVLGTQERTAHGSQSNCIKHRLAVSSANWPRYVWIQDFKTFFSSAFSSVDRSPKRCSTINVARNCPAAAAASALGAVLPEDTILRATVADKEAPAGVMAKRAKYGLLGEMGQTQPR
jgi:hypothetical protein